MGEPAYLTTKELAELLRIKERKVYDLAASGAVPHTKAMGKLLFPRTAVEAWLADHASAGTQSSPARPAVMLGSHDPVLEWALRESHCGIAALFDGSQDGIDRFGRGEGIAAGLHIANMNDDGWNTEAIGATVSSQPVVLIAFAMRQRGLIASTGAKISGFADLKGKRVMMRQQGAGTQTLFDRLLAQSGLSQDDIVVAGHAGNETEAALAVLEGKADVSFALEDIAHRYGLGFAPTVQERFDLLVDRKAYFEPPFQTLLDFLRSAAFRAHADALKGYDFTVLATVQFNGA